MSLGGDPNQVADPWPDMEISFVLINIHEVLIMRNITKTLGHN